MQLNWKVIPYSLLSIEQFYEIIKLRQIVFVVEQDCPYLDADGKDQKSLHVLGYHENSLAAYARLVEPGVSYAEPSIGRIVSSPNFRKKGMGKELMEVSINELQRHFGPLPIRISGQLYLQKFYEGFGFAKVGEQYLEDNIPHIEMLRPA